ncbi:hypothetical protein NL478_27860, partial [Klebsiella pneumoniae]|nr:hypothetical protein [Klebsiella pneumoniae]
DFIRLSEIGIMNPVTDVLVMLSWEVWRKKMIHQKQDNEIEKQEFLNYLDQHGVLNKITDVLLMLYNEPEQPSDVIDYV